MNEATIDALVKRYGEQNMEGEHLDYSLLSTNQVSFLLDPLLYNRDHKNNYFWVTRIQKLSRDDKNPIVILHADDVVLQGTDGNFAHKHVMYNKIVHDFQNPIKTIATSRTEKGDLIQDSRGQYELGTVDGEIHRMIISFWYKTN